YARLRELLAPLEARDLPILACPGNHDTRAAFRRGFLGQDTDDDARLQQTVAIDGLRVILLDSLVPGSNHGELGPEQLAWLVGVPRMVLVDASGFALCTVRDDELNVSPIVV